MKKHDTIRTRKKVMTTPRREFLKKSVIGLTAATMHGTGDVLGGAGGNRTTAQAAEDAIPPHQSLDLPGLHAYAEKSIPAGDTIHFRISSTLPYRLKVCRLAGGVDDLDADVALHAFPPSQPSPQPIHPGSYIHVARGLTVDTPLKALSLECWVRPWHVGRYQGLITQYDYPNSGGIGLFLSPGGTVELYLGDGGEYNRERGMTGPKLPVKKWSHIVASWDGDTATIWLNGKRAATSQLKASVRPGRCPLRLGAYGHNGLAANFLNGDMAMPTIYGRVLPEREIVTRFEAKALKTPPEKGLIACWPLSEEDGDQVADIGPQKRGGRIINHAAWMIGGPSFDAAKVGRFDKSYDPTKDKNRGHAVRFASDDLYDCRWQTTHTFKIPEDAKSGIYAGRFNYSVGDQPREYHVTFIVRKSKERPKAPILVLCSTNTWMAYNSAPFPVPVQGRPFINTGGLKNSVPEAPAYSMYSNHHPGQPTYYMGLNMPWPNAGPTVLYSPANVGYSHLTRGELFAHRWLDGHYGDHTGYDYDVVTDLDLHRDPNLLKDYRAVVMNGHSEYWSGEAMDAVDRYLAGGGKLMALTGNTMLWRVSYNSAGTVMECRKLNLGPGTGGRPGCAVGELYHSQDKRRGSLTQLSGHSPCDVVGLIGIGWSPHTGVYHLDEPDHFLFNRPEKVGLKKGDTFGHAEKGDYPRAIYHEWDVRLSTIGKMTKSIPQGATLPEEDPAGMVTLARGLIKPGGGGIFDYFLRRTELVDGMAAEMIYWKRPKGGEVFHAGAIPSGWTLSVDARMRTLLRNVLHHFGVKPAV